MQRRAISLSMLVAFALLQSNSPGAVADPSTNATCFSSYSWMNNERGQSPCLVAAYLLSPCSTSSSGANVPALNDSHSLYNFAGTSLDTTPCVCNTVTFSMLYACATCQGAELAVLPWYIVSENCTALATSFRDDSEFYPERISPDTSVPRWAYTDVTTTGRLDISQAKTFASEHEPDATLSGFYNAFSPSATAYIGPAPGWEEGEQLAENSQGVSVGVIVGAVVGGAIGLIMIVTGIIFIVRASRRRRKALAILEGPSVPSKECGEACDDSGALGSGAKLYDPDDPATYPSLLSSDALLSGKATPQAGVAARLDYAAATPWGSARSASQAAPAYPGRPEV